MDQLISGKEEIVLKSTTIENKTPNETHTTVTIEAQMEKSLEMEFKTSVSHTISTKASVSIDVADIVSIGFELGYEYTQMAEEGTIRIEKKTVTFRDEQDVTEPPFTKTTVAFVSTPIKGNGIPFTATYRINVTALDWPLNMSSRHSNEFLSATRIS